MAYSRYTAVTASAQTGHNVIWGWQFTETAGAAARVLLRDGSVTGTIIADIKLAAGESVGESYAAPIKLSVGNLYAEVNSGAVRGAVYGE